MQQSRKPFSGSAQFPGAAIKPNFQGLAGGAICWAVVLAGKKVVTWTLDEGRVWTGEWSELSSQTERVEAVNLTVVEPARTRTASKRKKSASTSSYNDGVCFFTESHLLIRPPVSSGMPIVTLVSTELGMNEDESITSLTGSFKLGDEECELFIGTSQGRVLRVLVNDSGESEATVPFAVKAPGFLARIATPWRRSAAQPKIVCLMLEKSVLYVLSTESTLYTLDRESHQVQTSWTLPKDCKAVGLGINGEHKLLIAALKDDEVSVFDSDGETYIPFTEWTLRGFPYKITPLMHMGSIALSCWSDAGVSLLDSKSLAPLLDDTLVSVSYDEGRGILVMTDTGRVYWEKGSGKKGPEKKINIESVQKHLKAVLAVVEELVSQSGGKDWKSLVDDITSVLSLNEDFIELGFANASAKNTARQKLLEYVVSRIEKEPDVGVKAALVLVTYVCLDLEWDTSVFLEEERMDDIASEELPLTLRFVGEAIFAAAGCQDVPDDVIARCRIGEDIEETLLRPDAFSNILAKICKLATKGREIDGSLMVLAEALGGIKQFNEIVQDRGGDLQSTIVRQFSSTIVASLSDASRASASAKALPPDRAKRMQTVCAALLECDRNAADALSPLLLLASTQSSPSTDTGRSMALVAAKELAEEFSQFEALIIACLEHHPEDLATIERCLKKWDTFPHVLFSWLLSRRRSKTTFSLVDRFGGAQTGQLYSELLTALEEPGVSRDLLWLAHTQKQDWPASAEVVRKTQFSSSLGILGAFATGDSGSFGTYIRSAIRYVDDPELYLDWLYLALVTSKTASEKDYVWANAVLYDVPAWRGALKQKSDKATYLSSTMYFKLLRCIRDSKDDNLAPGPDFFDNLQDNLGERVSARSRNEHTFALSEVPGLQAILKSLLF